MTALNLWVHEDHALIVTDSKMRAKMGEVFHGSKVIALPIQRLAVAVRGKQAFGPSITRIISMLAHDFDSARALLCDAKRFASLEFEDASEADAWADVWQLVVAGWSTRANAPAAFTVTNERAMGAEPWRLYDVGYIVSPVVPAARRSADPVEIVLAQAQAMPATIGGYVTATWITETGITQEVIADLDQLPVKAPLAA